MRPLELHLAHFGPYRGKVVLNFEALDRLFLVCGPTGAGKTTLFDALTYALYEKTAGTRGGLSDQLASHHAPEGSVPEVSLRFALGPQQWRVTRQLRHRARKTKGEGWVDRDPQVLLERRTVDGWEPLPGKKTEINQKLEDLLGLSADEFAKIVVLPQGDFQRFLEASTGEREKMLQKLFPVEAYERMVEGLKLRAKTVEDARRQWEDRWTELTAKLGSEPDDRQALEASWAEATAGVRAAISEVDQATSALERLKALHVDWTTLERKREEKARLEARRTPIEADRTRLNQAKKARPLGADLDRQAAITAEGLRIRAEWDAAHQSLTKVESGLAELAQRAPEIAQRQTQLAEVLKKRGLTEGQMAQWAEAQGFLTHEATARVAEERALARWTQAQADRARAEQALAPPPAGPQWDQAWATVEALREEQRRAIEQTEVELRRTEIRRDLEDLVTQLNAIEKTLSDADREVHLWAQIVASLQAAALAQTLEPGSPCPVCGSPHHPHPTPWPEASAEAPQRLAESQRVAQQARIAQASLQARRETLNLQLADIPKPVETRSLELVQKDLKGAEAQFLALQTWTTAQEQARKRLTEAVAHEAQADRERQEATQAREPWTHRLQALTQTVGSDPTPRLQGLKAQEAELRRKIDEDQGKMESLERTRERLKTQIEGLDARLLDQREEYRRLQTTLDRETADLGWSLDDLKKARLPEAEIVRLEGLVAAFDRDLHRLDGETSGLEAQFASGPPPPLEAATQALDERKTLRESWETLAKEREFALRQRDQIEEDLREVGRQKASLEAQFQSLVPLARALDGHNGLNLRLTTWVLVQALEQVVQSATQRLSAMSGGRYALKVQTRGSDARRVWGLDLSVVDGYTGQERAVGTLSGGEKFMTSISLALGLADVIQERSGGLKLEAIFIDEGFGTLDDQSLDRAMAILHDLGQHRSVGIISHVAELRQRITSRVEVVKGKDGSTLKIE